MTNWEVLGRQSEVSNMESKNKHPKPPPKQNVKDGLYKRGSSWCVRCMINGIVYRKSIGPSKAEAHLALAEMKKQRAQFRATGEMSGLEALFKRRERKTFAEAANEYMAERPHLKDATSRGYREILKNYLIPEFGRLSVDQISEQQIAKFQAEISEKVSATRVNNIMGPLRYILKQCYRRKLITDNPALNVMPLREEEPTIDPLNADELDKVLVAMKPHQRPLFICLAWTGCRPNELLALRWPNVNFDRNEIRINKGRVRGKEGTPKTRSSNRTVHMFSVVKQSLLELRSSTTQNVEGYVFLNRNGQPYDRHVDREWRVALKKADVRHRPSYQLRHTFASLCLASGLQPTWIAKQLGHSTPQITFKHYARYINDSANINENRLEEFLQSRQQAKCAQNWSH